ncbi:MAG: hypothetical protein L6V89_11715 [Oscillospiraceae bacterium]|nr:MAG: hypothetical protein L6V89_11715 [Oscillospiraceae bacterium]
MPPVMKSIQQKHVTDHRATYCYKPQRAILIIALQKISRFVFNGVPSKRFSFIKLHFYYTINMAIFQVPRAKKCHAGNEQKAHLQSKTCFYLLDRVSFLVRHPKATEKTSQVSAAAIPIWFLSISALQHSRAARFPEAASLKACAFLQLRLSLQIFQKNFQKNIDIRS